jgi:hypothetical protein
MTITKITSKEIIRLILGLIPLALLLIFFIYYYPILLNLANTIMERLGAFVILFVVAINLGEWAIKLGPK